MVDEFGALEAIKSVGLATVVLALAVGGGYGMAQMASWADVPEPPEDWATCNGIVCHGDFRLLGVISIVGSVTGAVLLCRNIWAKLGNKED